MFTFFFASTTAHHVLHSFPTRRSSDLRKLDWVKTSGLISPRYWSNLPAGEVFTTPATVDGTFVCDGTAGDYFNGKYGDLDRKSTRLNSSHLGISYAVFCLKKKKNRSSK